MRSSKILFITILILAFSIGFAYGEKGGQGKGRAFGHGRNRKSHSAQFRAHKELSCQLGQGKSLIMWTYNPHDLRGQGNMGKPDMIAPYGHDKDSDRLELYGNRGRVIRIVEPEPPPIPPPDPEPEPEPEPEPPPGEDPIPQPPF